MIRRCFLAALLFCAVSCPMMAQGGKVNVLYLDGTAHEVQLTKQSPITLRSNGYTITAEGMTDGKLLEVYAANGSLAAQATALGGKAKIDATQLAAGVYVVKAEGQSLKMVKR